jgi:hypothetical protein
VITNAIPRFAAGSSPTTIALGGAEPDVLGGFSIMPLCLGLRAYSALRVDDLGHRSYLA